jgi:3-oxosteroid 1-dehydrogenase
MAGEALEFDVVVAGSGAGGMMAAIRSHDLGLKPVVIEKSDHYGGTSAVSGGAIWIPCNPDIGTGDSPEKALEYLLACTKGAVPRDKLERYVEVAPKMLAYLTELGIRYRAEPVMSYPDYYPDLPGAVPHGRNMLVLPMEDGTVLGEEFFRLREAYPEFKLFDRISIDLGEGGILMFRFPGWMRVLAGQLWRYYSDLGWRRRTPRDRRLAIGNALIGGLRKAMLDRGIPLMLKTQLTRLVVEDDRVVAVEASCDGVPTRISATKGVVLATGGFEHSQELRDRYLDQKTDERWSATPRDNNVGDGLVAALDIGADTEFMNEAWWAPSIPQPSRTAPNTVRNVALFFERGFPHCLAVNRLGRRFVNEIRSYHQFGQAMLADNAATGANMPCWLVFDAEYRRKYPLGGLLPSSAVPDSRLPPDWLDSFLYKADTLAALAEKIRLPAAALSESVARFNRNAAAGVDQDFAKGGNVYGQFFGDPRHGPNKTLGPVATAPFYAVRLDLGDLGTKGGPKTNAEAMVLAKDGRPIPGLYAVGNVAGAAMGGAYPGAGATLGTAMTFAYVAAANLALKNTV